MADNKALLQSVLDAKLEDKLLIAMGVLPLLLGQLSEAIATATRNRCVTAVVLILFTVSYILILGFLFRATIRSRSQDRMKAEKAATEKAQAQAEDVEWEMRRVATERIIAYIRGIKKKMVSFKAITAFIDPTYDESFLKSLPQAFHEAIVRRSKIGPNNEEGLGLLDDVDYDAGS